ncbi:hypothetical protein XaC1_119 [Xanthomonas phage XaC1]|nr:hypothetical protein XaC1_119 [Xanthomonas phage XaC1]
MSSTEYTKLKTKVFGLLEGMTIMDPKYFKVREALIYGETVHTGTRKDGSPEFSHQMEMLAIAINFHTMMLDPYSVYLAIITHDMYEDYPQILPTLRTKFPEAEQYSLRLSKYKDTSEREYSSYFREIATCPVSSVVKLIDRIHNLSTAPGAFSNKKMLEYSAEAKQYFLPMLKEARNLHNQRTVYEILKSFLVTEMKIIDKLLGDKDEKTV